MKKSRITMGTTSSKKKKRQAAKGGTQKLGQKKKSKEGRIGNRARPKGQRVINTA